MDARNLYATTTVLGDTPAGRVSQLYAGAIRFCVLATRAIEAGDTDAANTNLLRAQAVIGELQATLNPEVGAIAVSLDALYDFFLRELLSANLTKSSGPVIGVEQMLRDLLPAWQEAARVASAAAAAPTGIRLNVGRPALALAAR